MDSIQQYDFSHAQSYDQFIPIPVPDVSYQDTSYSQNSSASFVQAPAGFIGPYTSQIGGALNNRSQDERQDHNEVLDVLNPVLDFNDPSEEGVLGTGNSEEDDCFSTVQSKRKAQNRIAQRAFRERKEKHVKDLQGRLDQLASENEDLKRRLHAVSAENDILRRGQISGKTSPELSLASAHFESTDLYSNFLRSHSNQDLPRRAFVLDSGERLLAAGAAWDFITNHQLLKRGLVNIDEVSKRLKQHHSTCGRHGPVFSERAILAAIEQSIPERTDGLL